MKKSPFTTKQLCLRALWNAVSALLFRPSPRIFFGWRRLILCAFGAKIHRTARVYNRVRIWAPWKLRMEAGSSLAEDVECYNVDMIVLEERAIASQHSFLCAASHDIMHEDFKLLTAPIRLERCSWVCAGAFVGMGVTLGEGSVAAARSLVVKDVAPWTVVGGNPARFIKARVISP